MLSMDLFGNKNARTANPAVLYKTRLNGNTNNSPALPTKKNTNIQIMVAVINDATNIKNEAATLSPNVVLILSICHLTV